MNPKDEEGIDREAWRRQLGDAGAPTSLTDARIRAEARRALTPRIGRWWLPASLAASLVLAVFLVQWQFEGERAPAIVDESDVSAPDARMDSAAPAETPVAAPMMELPATGAEAKLRRDETQERARQPARESSLEEYSTVPVPPPPPAEREPRPATDDAGSSLGNFAQEPAASEREDRAERSRTMTDARLAKQAAVADKRTPEQWYAEIEALRAAGKDAEADAELEKLEAAHPGWLESHKPDQP